jgi:5-methylcytosine-specific restriction protein A
MTRNLPEWIAAHDDQAIPQRVKLRIWTRCGGRCALTGRKLRPGDAYQFDHIINERVNQAPTGPYQLLLWQPKR